MRGYVDTSWGQVHFRAGGTPIPAAERFVVLLHESPRDSRVYEPVLDAFPPGVATIALDTPGFGSSDDAPPSRPLSEYAAVLIEALDRIGVGRAVVVGMKTGGYLGIHMLRAAGRERFPAAVLYAMDAADQASNDRWAEEWAPPLDFSDGRALLLRLWEKNLTIYGPDAQRECAEATADAVANADRYNSVYPAVFRGMSETFAALQAAIDDGVRVRMLEPPSAAMTSSEPIAFVRLPGTETTVMPVTGQFPRRATPEFVAAVDQAITCL
jgi:haloalkane dehalogenase